MTFPVSQYPGMRNCCLISTQSVNVYIFIYLYLKVKVTEKDTQREWDLPSTASLPKLPQPLELSSSEARSEEFCLDYLCAFRDLSSSDSPHCFFCFSSLNMWRWIIRTEHRIKMVPTWNVGTTSWGLAFFTTATTPVEIFLLTSYILFLILTSFEQQKQQQIIMDIFVL